MRTALRAKALFVILVILSGVALDQAVKIAAVRALEGGAPVTLPGGLVQLRSVENRGAMLSLGSGLTPHQRLWVFTIAECALLAGLVVYALLSSGTSTLELWAVALVAAGGAGNVLDRVALGYVRDYVLIGVHGLPTAAFNLADVLVVVGAVLLVAGVLRSRRGAQAAATLLIVGAGAIASEPVRAEPAPRPFPVRMVKLGGRPGDPKTLDHLAFCRELGFNAVWVFSHQAGRWTKTSAPRGPRLDPEFLRLARWCRERGMEIWVSANPVADTGDRFVFDDPDGERRLLRFAKALAAQAGVRRFVVSFDDQPTELRELSDVLRYGRSSAPAHLDLAKRLAGSLPRGTSLWLCAAAYCDAHLGDGTTPYAKAFLEGLPALPPAVGIVWTGPRVVSPSITRGGLEATRARLGGRPLLLYDNFPANDDDQEDALALVLGALRAREAGVRDVVAAYLACPMTELGASRLPLMTTAAFLADPESYDPDAAVATAIGRIAGPDREAKAALETQQLEWGGFVDGPNYWPRDALHAAGAAGRLIDPAFVASFTWTESRYPGRMAALEKLADARFRDDLLRAMRRRLAVARAMPLAVEYAARVRAGRADAAEVVARIEAQRRETAGNPDTARILDLFLLAADIPIS